MGIPPRRLTGWEPATTSWTLNGATHTTREPEWDWIDRGIIAAWQRLNERLCPQCKRPLSLHKQESAHHAAAHDPDEAASRAYGVAYLTCPATLAIDRAQAQQDKADEPKRRAGLSPDRARTWMSFRADEGLPDFDDD